MENTANTVLIIVEGNEGIISPSFAKNLSAVESVGVSYAVDSLACSDAVIYKYRLVAKIYIFNRRFVTLK